MGIQAYIITAPFECDDRSRGIALVCTTSGIPLPLSVNAFDDPSGGFDDDDERIERADAFVAWCLSERSDPRLAAAVQLEAWLEDWKAGLKAEEEARVAKTVDRWGRTSFTVV